LFVLETKDLERKKSVVGDLQENMQKLGEFKKEIEKNAMNNLTPEQEETIG
jgi:hypothetical protein